MHPSEPKIFGTSFLKDDAEVSPVTRTRDLTRTHTCPDVDVYVCAYVRVSLARLAWHRTGRLRQNSVDCSFTHRFRLGTEVLGFPPSSPRRTIREPRGPEPSSDVAVLGDTLTRVHVATPRLYGHMWERGTVGAHACTTPTDTSRDTQGG